MTFTRPFIGGTKYLPSGFPPIQPLDLKHCPSNPRGHPQHLVVVEVELVPQRRGKGRQKNAEKPHRNLLKYWLILKIGILISWFMKNCNLHFRYLARKVGNEGMQL